MRSLVFAIAVLFIAGCSSDAPVTTTNQKPAPIPKGPDNTLILQLKDGNVRIQMRPDLAPNHVARVKKLVREKFYDGLKWHRVITGFMAQTGDPTGTGRGGSNYPPVKAEFSDEPFVTGTVGAARTQDRDSANSQFFICFAPAPHLNGQYTVWGKVIKGMDVVNKIKKGAPGSGTITGEPDKIIKAYILSDKKN